MIGRDRAEGGAEEGVGPRREDLEPVLPAVEREEDARALGAADPLLLHDAHALGPALERRQAGEQVVGKTRDAQEPLRQEPLLDERARAPAAPVDHLLVGEHGVLDRVPVDPGFAPVGEIGREEVQEHLLFVAVILGMAGRDLAPPVVGQPHALQLLAHDGDVLERPARRVLAALHRRVLGRQPERVPPHRVQHVHALRALVARDHVAHRVVAHVPDMELAGRVGKHLQHVVFRPRRIGLDRERAAARPRSTATSLRSLSRCSAAAACPCRSCERDRGRAIACWTPC